MNNDYIKMCIFVVRNNAGTYKEIRQAKRVLKQEKVNIYSFKLKRTGINVYTFENYIVVRCNEIWTVKRKQDVHHLEYRSKRECMNWIEYQLTK